MENVYFESYNDCFRKFGSILKAVMAPPPIYTYISNQTEMDWPAYNGSVSIGDDSAMLRGIFGSFLRVVNTNTSKAYYLISPREGTPTSIPTEVRFPTAHWTNSPRGCPVICWLELLTAQLARRQRQKRVVSRSRISARTAVRRPHRLTSQCFRCLETRYRTLPQWWQLWVLRSHGWWRSRTRSIVHTVINKYVRDDSGLWSSLVTFTACIPRSERCIIQICRPTLDQLGRLVLLRHYLSVCSYFVGRASLKRDLSVPLLHDPCNRHTHNRHNRRGVRNRAPKHL